MNEKEFNVIFSKNPNYYMDLKSITQNELAKQIGVSPTSVNNWCNGYKTPRMDKVDRICDFFRIKRSDLMNERDNFEDTAPSTLSPAESNLLHEYRNDELEGASLFQICRAVWKLNGAGRVAVLKYAEYLGTDPDYLLHPEDA